MKSIGVILCGSGFKDGSEIRESVGALWALSYHAVQVHCFAPDAPQMDVVNCVTGNPAPAESRNQLVEAARIARGEIAPLSAARAQALDAVIIPGGFGVAKNLCTFAVHGGAGTVRDDVATLLRDLHAAGKPLGAICIAPALLAMTFPHAGFALTVGAEGEVPREIEKLGHTHVVCAANAWHIDRVHKIVTTPAYMHDTASLNDIFTGIRGLVDAIVAMA